MKITTQEFKRLIKQVIIEQSMMGDEIVMPIHYLAGRLSQQNISNDKDVVVRGDYVLELINEIEGEAAFEGLPDTKKDKILHLKNEILKWSK